MTVFGCDLSHFQASIPDLTGMSFVFHKCTEGSDYVDPVYSGRQSTVHNTGRIWGAYHFFRMSADVGAQVQWFIDHATIKTGDIIALDFEDVAYDSWSNYPHSVVASKCTEVMHALRGAFPNNRLVLYCNESTLTDYVQRYGIPTYDGLWIADPSGRPSAAWVFWQYTSSPFDKDLSDSFADDAHFHVWALNTPPPIPFTENDMFEPITVDMAHGRAHATLECGSNSAVVTDAWAAVKPLWGDLPPVTVVVTDDSGAAKTLTTQTMKQNDRYWWKLPSGTSGVTWDGYVIGK
jgi:hypothetical protein